MYQRNGEPRRLLGHRELRGGLVLSEYAFAGGVRFAVHRHDRAKFCLVTRGGMREVRGGCELARSAGSVTFLAAGESHAEQFSEGGVSAFAVELDRGWLAGHGVDLDPVRVGFRELHAAAPMVCRLREELRHFDDVSRIEIEGLALELTAQVLRITSRRARETPRWLLTVRDRLQQEYRQPLGLTRLAEGAGVHPVRLSRQFRRHFGCSPGQYVRRRRVEVAKELIRAGKLSLAAVALAVGFWDQSHFTRTFGRITGMAPAGYRLRVMGDASKDT